PYYANPSWDQRLPVSTRFIVLSNWVDTDFPSGGAAVLDRETGLVWQRSPARIFLDFEKAADGCVNAGTGGKYGWRLPTAPELASLLETSGTGPFPRISLPVGHPFTTVIRPFSSYWTTTTAEEFQSFFGGRARWGVEFVQQSAIASPFIVVA